MDALSGKREVIITVGNALYIITALSPCTLTGKELSMNQVTVISDQWVGMNSWRTYVKVRINHALCILETRNNDQRGYPKFI